MDIQNITKNKNALCFLLLFSSIAYASVSNIDFSSGSTEVFISTYQNKSRLTESEADSMINNLERVVKNNLNQDMFFRINYRVGILNFKAGRLKNAERTFLQVAGDLQCNKLIRLCSYNMLGQIHRLRGEDKDALNDFKEVIDICEEILGQEGSSQG